MPTHSKGFIELLMKASSGNAEASLKELAVLLELPEDEFILSMATKIESALAEYDMELAPGLKEGDEKTLRRIKRRGQKILGTDEVRQELIDLESPTLEFKSSLFFDHNRFKAQPHASASELKSGAVTHSALKSIAALLNSKGGVLYLGVDDDHNPCGIKDDYRYVTDADEWELSLRGLIEGRFKDGRSINSYIDITFHELDGEIIVRVAVSPRTSTSYLKKQDGKYGLYERQGNRTVELGIDEVEEFLKSRNQ